LVNMIYIYVIRWVRSIKRSIKKKKRLDRHC